MAVADVRLAEALAQAHSVGNLTATTVDSALADASVAVVDVPVELVQEDGVPSARFTTLRTAVRTLGRYMRPGTLVIVESTVPPGTTERVVAPELAGALRERDLPGDAVLLAHSFERVMPGERYLESLVRYWRCYAGTTPEAADACRRFLEQVIDVEAFPLTRLHSTTASETAKVLENSYRATTIALMEEWGRLAEAIGVDLFEVVERSGCGLRTRTCGARLRRRRLLPDEGPALRRDRGRPAVREPEPPLPISEQAVAVNRDMPISSVDKLEEMLGGSVAGRSVLLMGVRLPARSSPTRGTPASATFVRGGAASRGNGSLPRGGWSLALARAGDLTVETGSPPRPNGGRRGRVRGDRAVSYRSRWSRRRRGSGTNAARRSWTRTGSSPPLSGRSCGLTAAAVEHAIGRGAGSLEELPSSPVGAGFIGVHLARALVGRGDTVDLVDDFSRGRLDAELDELRSSPSIRLLALDLLDGAVFDDLDADYDRVVHLAAIVGVAHVLDSPHRTLRANATMTDHVLGWGAEAAAAAAIPVRVDQRGLRGHPSRRSEGPSPRPRMSR